MLKLKIRSKILIGFLITIILTFILGFISYSSLNLLSNKLIPVIKANERVTSQMLSLRKNEKDYLARSVIDPTYFTTGKSSYLDDFKTNYDKLLQEVATVKAFATDAKGQANLNEIEKLTVEYKDLFFKVVDKKKIRGFKDWGKEGELRAAVHDVEATLDDNKTYIANYQDYDLNTQVSGASKSTKDDLLILMLQMRRSEKDFFIRNDLSYRDKLNGLVGQFNEKVTASNMASGTKTNLLNLVGVYKMKFNEVADIMVEIGLAENDGIMGQYRQTIHQLEPLVSAQAQVLENQANAIVANTNRIVVITIILIALFGILFATLLAHRITSPLRKLTKAGNLIADGKLDTEVPQITTGDEVQDISLTVNLLIGAVKYLKNESESKKK